MMQVSRFVSKDPITQAISSWRFYNAICEKSLRFVKTARENAPVNASLIFCFRYDG
jgi:hypothetical protein